MTLQMNFQKFQAAIAAFPTRTKAQIKANTRHTVLRDNFPISTWLAFGAAAQGIVAIFFNPLLAVAPVLLLLLVRSARAMLASWGLLHNAQMDGVIQGKFSAQLPDRDGNAPTRPSQENVAILTLATRSNHALGILGPGFSEVSAHLVGLVDLLNKNKEEAGFLGSSNWISLNERQTANQIMTCCYFRSVEDILKFAHGPRHRETWNWWNRIYKSHPHLSIMHEMYASPAGMWENVYHNHHLSGIANVQVPLNLNDEQLRPIIDVTRGQVLTSRGRMGWTSHANANNSEKSG